MTGIQVLQSRKTLLPTNIPMQFGRHGNKRLCPLSRFAQTRETVGSGRMGGALGSALLVPVQPVVEHIESLVRRRSSRFLETSSSSSRALRVSFEAFSK